MPAPLNYATQYAQALAQAYPYALNFGALYATENNGRYRVVNARSIEIPSITVGGRVDANRDTIATATRNFDNAWETKLLRNQRKWGTLVHPMDIEQTNMVATIANITRVMNEEEKFPEMDAYCISSLYSAWTDTGRAALTTELTTANVLEVFDQLMQTMTEKRVTPNGRILYVTPAVDTMIKNATQIQRNFQVQQGSSNVQRVVTSIDNVQIVVVPPELMKTAYNFTTGWVVGATAQQINMFLVHPNAVITPVSYTAATLDPPQALSELKWVYYEEAHEDVFILNNKADALQFVVTEIEEEEEG